MRRYFLNFTLFILSIVFALFMGECFLRIWVSGAEGLLLSFKKYPPSDYPAIIRANPGLLHDETLYNYNPEPRTYGSYRQESRMLASNFNGAVGDDLMKIWNRSFLDSIFIKERLYYAKGMLGGYGTDTIFAFDAPDGSPYPIYRYLSNASIPESQCRFNRFGFSGSDIAFQKPPRTVRIAFLGGSTTQQMGPCAFGYPDYIEAWLNKWATQRGLHLNFEVINAGRVALHSMDFAAIYKYEIHPLQPEVIVYYEGRNQFDLMKLCGFSHYGSMQAHPVYRLLIKSVLLQLVFDRLNIDLFSMFEESPLKKKMKLPAIVSSSDPDLTEPMPIQLNQICSDIDKIWEHMDTSAQSLLLNGFCMVTHDSVLRTRKEIYSYWLHDYGLVKVSDIALLHRFENTVFRKFAMQRGMYYSDAVAGLAKHPELFIDGIHFSCEGAKMQAWAVFSSLLPIIEKNISSGKWPIHQQTNLTSHPYLEDECYPIDFNKLYRNNE